MLSSRTVAGHQEPEALSPCRGISAADPLVELIQLALNQFTWICVDAVPDLADLSE